MQRNADKGIVEATEIINALRNNGRGFMADTIK